jgi:hypothetical protein
MGKYLDGCELVCSSHREKPYYNQCFSDFQYRRRYFEDEIVNIIETGLISRLRWHMKMPPWSLAVMTQGAGQAKKPEVFWR